MNISVSNLNGTYPLGNAKTQNKIESVFVRVINPNEGIETNPDKKPHPDEIMFEFRKNVPQFVDFSLLYGVAHPRTNEIMLL